MILTFIPLTLKNSIPELLTLKQRIMDIKKTLRELQMMNYRSGGGSTGTGTSGGQGGSGGGQGEGGSKP